VHLNRLGDQCLDQALPDRQLCAFHARMLEDYDDETEGRSPERNETKSRFPIVYRLAALVVLLLILMETFGSIRTWLDF
jgi:hypothetical protein